MKITSIIENTSKIGLPIEHGLSLYMQLSDGKNVLFDMGQDHLFADNAQSLGLKIEDVDIAVISHGHYDHGGGLSAFLELNSNARVYIHEDAFLPHYSLRENGLRYIGIDKTLISNKRLIMCSNVTKVNDYMTLFSDVKGNCCCPHGNRLLYESTHNLLENDKNTITNDLFSHEQNLIIEEGDNIVLIAGCAHRGIVNILEKSIEVTNKIPTHVFAGMHLVKSGLDEDEEQMFIATLANELMKYKSTQFYTMHCTGVEQYLQLKAIMQDQINYLSCGEYVEL